MAPLTIPALKFIGTISLGLLTGISYSSATQTLPALLSLPSAETASAALARHVRLRTLHTIALAGIAISTFGLAYVLAPARGGRHPYLLWTGLMIGLGQGADWLRSTMKGRTLADEVGEVNGEEVRRSLAEGRTAAGVQSGMNGLAFGMAVIGLIGEGVVRRVGT